MRILIPGGSSGQVGTWLLARASPRQRPSSHRALAQPATGTMANAGVGRSQPRSLGRRAQPRRRRHPSFRTQRQLPLQRRKPPPDLRLARSAYAPARTAHRSLAHAAARLAQCFQLHRIIATPHRPTANDEFTGVPADLPAQHAAGGVHEPGNLPETWSFSADVIDRWESALAAVDTPHTRKIRLRTSMVMSPDAGGVFSVFSKLTRLGLGGTQAYSARNSSPGSTNSISAARLIYCSRSRRSPPKLQASSTCARPTLCPIATSCARCGKCGNQAIGLPAWTWMLVLGAIPDAHRNGAISLNPAASSPACCSRMALSLRLPNWPEAAAQSGEARMKAKAV